MRTGKVGRKIAASSEAAKTEIQALGKSISSESNKTLPLKHTISAAKPPDFLLYKVVKYLDGPDTHAMTETENE